MYCIKCGNKLSEANLFCNQCGTKISKDNEINEVIDENNEIDENNKKNEEYTFVREKSIGRASYATIITNLFVEDSFISIQQERRILYFFRKMKIESKIKINEINNVTIKKNMDPSDLIFAIAFGILGFFNPLLFIMSALLLWTGYGKRIDIFIRNDKYSIPTQGGSDVDKLLQTIKNTNPMVTVRN